MSALATVAAPIEEMGLREAMRALASGVCVVTAGLGEERVGLTVNSAISLSMAPPTMIVCINRTASSMPVFRRYRHYCVNILEAGQVAIANRFAGRDGRHGAARYEDASWTMLETGALALDGALASVDCVIDEMIERHSHAILIGSVSAVRLGSGAPLLYQDGHFGSFAA